MTPFYPLLQCFRVVQTDISLDSGDALPGLPCCRQGSSSLAPLAECKSIDLRLSDVSSRCNKRCQGVPHCPSIQRLCKIWLERTRICRNLPVFGGRRNRSASRARRRLVIVRAPRTGPPTTHPSALFSHIQPVILNMIRPNHSFFEIHSSLAVSGDETSYSTVTKSV